MNTSKAASKRPRNGGLAWILLLVAMILTTAAYSTGLSGGYLFDDFPNIVDNHGVQPEDAKLSSLVGAALSSPSSEFKRPLASLSFAANYLATGLNPYWMKLTNLVIHLLNGLLAFLLARALLGSRIATAPPSEAASIATETPAKKDSISRKNAQQRHISVVAALIAAAWMLLPINVTAVLYVVQRMESLANLFVMLGLTGYVLARRQMTETTAQELSSRARASLLNRNFLKCLISITVPTAVGLLAKETAVMLPLYALMVEWVIFRFNGADASVSYGRKRYDLRIVGLFLVVLVLPMTIGLAWMVPGLINPATWATRDFTLATRLLSEARIIVDYIVWTVLPEPHNLSFYHDNFVISAGLLRPWTTSASIIVLALVVALTFWLRSRKPFIALGLSLFLSCQLLTGTIIPLELIYEHRNYFASFGLLLALVPWLAAPSAPGVYDAKADVAEFRAMGESGLQYSLPMAAPRYVLLGALMLFWTGLTAITAYAWGNPIRLAEDLAARAPNSPRAQYELGRTYIIASRYDPTSPFIKLLYAPLERAAKLPGSSILPEQALIFTNARMHLPVKDVWWTSLINKLKSHTPTVQDESSLAALTRCVIDRQCDLPANRMVEAFLAALSHPAPNGRLLANYGDYGWNVLDDKPLGERMTRLAIAATPNEPAYRITLIRMLAVQNRAAEARDAIKALEKLNYGGSLDNSLAELRALPGLQ